MNRLGSKPFGANKYAALNLLIAKWARSFAIPSQAYHYVTLGGAKLHDLACVGWIDRRLVSSVVSFEEDPGNFELALAAAQDFMSRGVSIRVEQDDIFNFRRSTSEPHIFFVDLPEALGYRQHRDLFRAWFDEGVVYPGDLLLLTSVLQRGASRRKTLDDFREDFRVLSQSGLFECSTLEDKNRLYEYCHPFFVVHSALRAAGQTDELMIASVGCVKYRDRFNLGIYAMAIQEGKRNFAQTISKIEVFDMTTRQWHTVV